MSFKIGDIVKCRSQKDLFCEFGEAREPYHPCLLFNSDLINAKGIVCNKDYFEINGGHSKTIICVNYDSEKWWYYPDVLERVKADEI